MERVLVDLDDGGDGAVSYLPKTTAGRFFLGNFQVAVRAKTTKRMDEEEDGKDSDQTTDSASSARSFNVLLRHGSQESVNEADLETPSPVGVSQE